MPPLPNAPSVCGIETNSLNAMLPDHPSSITPDSFSDEWGAADTKDALTFSGVNDASLKDLTVTARVLVCGVPTMHLALLKVCYCLLHSYRPNSLVVVHWTGGGQMHILRTLGLGVIEQGIVLIFIVGCLKALNDRQKVVLDD